MTLNKALNKYDNLLLAEDLNINTLRPTSDSSNHLSDLNDTFSLTNLVTDSTCFRLNKGTLIDLMLTNKPKSFYKSHSFVTGLSDCHKLIVSILRTSFQKLPPKFVIYRNQKNFHESNFLRDLDSRLIQGELYKNCEDPYTKLSEIFSEVLNYHAPLKQKSVRGNHAPFMTRELSKAIMTKSKVKNSYVKWPSRENFVAYKKAKNKCNSLTRKAKRKFFKEATKSGVMSNRTFWKTVKPFLTIKGCMTNDIISIEKDGDIVRDEKVLVELFNENYINIVEISSGKKTSSLGNCEDSAQDDANVDKIISQYSSHPSVQKIKREFSIDKEFASAKDINQIIKSLNINVQKGPDGISAKFVKISADIIDCHIANIINKDISNNKFSENAKTTTVRPIFKKGDRTEIKNYRPVSLLNIFTKIYDRFLHENLTNYVDTFLSKLISAYRKSYSSNHVLIRLIESWKKPLDQKNL